MMDSPRNQRKAASNRRKAWRIDRARPLSGRWQYHQVPAAPPVALRVPPSVGPPAASQEWSPAETMVGSRRAVRVLSGLGVTTLLTGVIGLTTHQIIYNAILDKQLELRPDSPAYPYWQSMQFPMYMKCFFWSVTNSEEVLLTGARPVLRELGPYTYLIKEEKVNVTWNRNHTVTFMQSKSWFFVPEMSDGSLEDVVTTLNVPLMGAARTIHTMNGFVISMVNTMLNRVGSKPFVSKTVRELLFEGYEDPLLTAATVMKHFVHIPLPYDKFAWFYTTAWFNMDTGHHPSQLGNLYSWNFDSRSSAFDAECGAINGSAGELFPARLGRDQVAFYSPDLCRTLTIPYDRQASISGLVVNRYSADERLFGSPGVNPDNWCNCHGECLPSGLLDQSKCKFGVSGFTASLPHMLFADPSVINETVGQRPDVNRHNLYMDLEPTTGVAFSLRARFQINILMRPYERITVLNNLSTANVPMLWFEIVLDSPEDLADRFIIITVTLPLVLEVTCWCLAAAGAVLLCAGALLSLRQPKTV